MALIRPNHTIIFDLDERLATAETKQEINRCYSFIGGVLVRTHAPESDAEDAPFENTVRMIVSVGAQRYLRSSDEGADELWRDVVGPSIGNMLHKVGANMKAFNRRQRKIDLPPLDFGRFVVELQGGEFSVALSTRPTSEIGRDEAAQVELARELLNDGTLEGAVRVDAPSAAFFNMQRDALLPAWEEEQAAKAAAEAEAAAEEELDEEEQHRKEIAEQLLADHERGTDRFFDEEWLAADAERKSYENTAVAPVDTDDLPPAYHEPEAPEPELFDFDVDYRMWDVTFEDGSVRTFDSETREFADDELAAGSPA